MCYDMKKALSLTPQSFTDIPQYVFLDTALSSDKHHNSYLFLNPIDCVTAFQVAEVPSALKKIEKLSQQYWLAGYLRYEASAAFLPRCHRTRADRLARAQPLLWFGVYKKPQTVVRVDDANVYAAPMQALPGMSYADYRQSIRAIKEQLSLGNTYQVNFTFDMRVRAGCSPEFLYFLLRRQQRTPYCAMIKNVYEDILSFSPELFFARDGSRIWTHPMKGTAARGKTKEHDIRMREHLQTDAKNRAENLMIVDLLRNDFSRICKPGTVTVPSMFNIETHPTVHQMTSVVQGDLMDHAGYVDIFQSIFPCGSVTGAPKIETMNIIHRLEQGTRGVYCGAIGYISPRNKAVFSVPIRILQKTKEAGDWQYRAGGGIVWDSSVTGEWEEVKVKTAFLTARKVPVFELLETMLWDGKCIGFEKEHVTRLKKSAKALKFKLQFGEIERAFKAIKIKFSGRHRMVRVRVSKDGTVSCDALLLRSLHENFRVKISDLCLDSENTFLKHKTTYRPWYAETMKKIRNGQVWDEIFFNQHREVCEGARSNIFIKRKGKLFTPPLSSGLLPGIFRRQLLRDGACEEKVLYMKDLKSAEAIYCGNSVRGLTQVRIL